MRFILLSTIGCLLIVSCSSDGSPADGPGPTAALLTQSGSRLKLRVRTNADGLRDELGLFDSERNEDCSIGANEDGDPACVPANLASDVTEVYLDMACTTKGLLTTKSCKPGPVYQAHSTSSTAASCKSYAPRTYRELKPLENPPTTSYYLYEQVYNPNTRLYEYKCNAHALQPAHLFVTGGEDIPAGSFVTFETARAPGNDRLDVIVQKGSDGTVIPQRGSNGSALFYDTKLKVRCAIESAEGGCIPFDSGSRSIYTDSSCTVPGVTASDCPGVMDEQRYVNLGERYFQLGAEADAYRLSGSFCDTYQLAEGEKAFALGAEVDFTEFARTLLVPSTYGRIRLLNQVRLGGSVLYRLPSLAGNGAYYWDTKLNVACRPFDLPDGSSRCVPNVHGETISPMFTDAACTQAVFVVLQSRIDPGPFPQYVITRGLRDENACFPMPDVRRVGAKMKYESLWELTSSGCQSAGSNLDGYDASEAVSLDDFAKLEIKTE